jgi:DNA recombination protein RmuC
MEALPLVLGLLLVAAAILCAGLVWDRLRLLTLHAEAAGSRDAAETRTAELEHALNQAIQNRHDLDERVEALQIEAAQLTERLESARREHAARVEVMERERSASAEREEKRLREVNDAYQEKLEALAAKALKASNEQFLELAGEALKRHHQRADSMLTEKQKALADLVSPISETLKKTDERLTLIDKSRAESQSALDQHLRLLSSQTKSLEDQTHRLVQSLKAPHVRGRWGEMALRNAVELAGMTEHCDFDTQASVAADDGASRRPDMTIHLPGERVIVVDAKTPLHAYLEAIEADSDERRADRLKAHARQLRQKVDDLASKGYQAQFDNTLDFVVLFVPGEQFLSAALLEDPALYDHALARNVVLTTPSTLIALLKAVALGWSQASLADDAREILSLGRQLHERVSTMTRHLNTLGKRLASSVGAYNDAMGSLEARVLPSVRRMQELNVRSTSELPESAERVTVEPRLPGLPEPDASDPPAGANGSSASKPTTRAARPASKKKATRKRTQG